MQPEGSIETAQTSVDFLIGVSIFAIALLFVLQAASSTVVNVAPESQTKEAVAERAGTIIYQDYAEGDGDILEQGYEDIENDLVGGLEDEYDINVTVTNLQTGAVTNTTGSRGVMPDRTTSSIAGERRVANVNGEASVVKLRVWDNLTVTGGGPSS